MYFVYVVYVFEGLHAGHRLALRRVGDRHFLAPRTACSSLQHATLSSETVDPPLHTYVEI